MHSDPIGAREMTVSPGAVRRARLRIQPRHSFRQFGVSAEFGGLRQSRASARFPEFDMPVHRFCSPAWLVLAATLASRTQAGPVSQDAEAFAKGVAAVNDAHARQPGTTTEADIGRKLPVAARSALKRVLDAKPSPETAEALASCGEAALDLDLVADFQALRNRLEVIAPERAAALGTAVSRPRFIVRGIGGLDENYLHAFAGVFDAVLAAYDDVFGFKEWSKVPGKKLRVRVHLEPEIKKPPHFAPQFPWHSEIDFPVIDATEFRSPTPNGHFLFYGLCHELGHVIAMWGDQNTMEDHHAWAHYTGVVIAEHLAKTAGDKPFMKSLGDVRWRSLSLERNLPENKVGPSVDSKPGVMALLIRLHDEAGPKAIGNALNLMDERKRTRRINHVRYYSFADFKKALGAVISDRKKSESVAELFK
jgi:hypothetical protein